MDELFKYASQTYAVDYFGMVIVVCLLEWVVPRRPPGDTLRLRWIGNIALTVLDTIIIRSLFPLLGVGWAMFCRAHGWGLFNQFNCWPWLAVVMTVIALDVVYYLQHYLLHRVPWLWRFHLTHHTDQEYDFTTALRFHPLESVYTNCVILAAILVLGAPPIGVFLSQLLAVGLSFVEHANVRMPSRLDRLLRLVLVTPDMHRVHHSTDAGESQSNFANTFSWWDRLFGTYRGQPLAGHDAITFGVIGFEARKHLTIPWMLAQPFMREPDSVDASPEPPRTGLPAASSPTTS